MHSTFLLISFIGFFIALIYAVKEYFPDFYDTVALLFKIGLKSDDSPPKIEEDPFEDSPSRGVWDESSIYYSPIDSSIHDD